MLSVRVGATWTNSGPSGGRWLHGMIPFGELGFATSLRRCTDSSGGGGILTIEWRMATPYAVSLPAEVRQGQLAEVYAGGVRLGIGYVAETPRGDEVTCDGLFRLGEGFYAIDSLSLPTTNVRTAVQQAITRGLRWRDPGDLPNTSISTLSEDNVQYSTVSALLNRYCMLNGKVWWIDRHGVLRIADLPVVGSVTPRWVLSPQVPSMQTADDDFASTVIVRRVNGLDADGQPDEWDGELVSTPSPIVRESVFDLEQMGYMDAASATAAAGKILDANKARSAFTEGVSLTRGQITTPGGVAPEAWQVSAVGPCVVRDPNYVNSSGVVKVGRSVDFIVGGTQFKQGEPLTVTPFEMAPRTQAQIVQAQREGEEPRLVFS